MAIAVEIALLYKHVQERTETLYRTKEQLRVEFTEALPYIRTAAVRVCLEALDADGHVQEYALDDELSF